MMKYILLMLISLSALVSCSDLTSPARFEGDVYSIVGMIVAGKPIDRDNPIFVTRSASLDNFDPMQLFVDDAAVQIKDVNDPAVDYTLTLDMNITFYRDQNETQHIIQAGHTYRIEVTVPGYNKTISAETTVPHAATLVPDYYQWDVEGEGFTLDKDNITDIEYETINQRYPLALETGNYAGGHNLYAEVYCLEDFSTDLEFTNPVFGQTNADETMESNYNSSGETVRRILIVGRFTSLPHNGEEGNVLVNYLLVKDYKSAFVFFGKYRVKVYSVDDNFYRYTYMPDGYFHGGVKNGLGYFGSATGGVMYGRIVK